MTRRATPKPSDEEAARSHAHDQFMISRAEAINAYAECEFYLADLFHLLLGSERRRAFVAFAAVMDNRSRLRMIATLLQISYGSEYDKFFDSIIGKLEGISSTRNKIVHWASHHLRRSDKPFNAKTDVVLAEHPNMYGDGRLFKYDLDDFAVRTRFYSLLLFYFTCYLKFPDDSFGDPNKRPWHDIFHEEVTYPPPEDHPLHRTHKKS